MEQNEPVMFLEREADEDTETAAIDPSHEPLDVDRARELVMSLSADASPASELYRRFGLGKESVFEMINPALERLVRQVERTFEHYSVTMGRESVSAIYVSTAMDVYRPIVDYIGSQLSLESDILDPLDPGHDFVAGAKEGSTISDRSAFVPVLGVALSDTSRTLNLIHTSEDKEKRERYDWLNKAVMAIFLALMISAVGYYLHLDGVAKEKLKVAASLERKLSQNIQVNEPMILKMISEIKEEQEIIRSIKRRYTGIAVFGEIAKLTPASVKIFNVKADWGNPVAKDEKNKQGIIIEGIVSGDAETLDSGLAGYLFKLQSSPLFDKAVIKTKRPEKRDGLDTLRFTLAAVLN
jgi:hypothetical protein